MLRCQDSPANSVLAGAGAGFLLTIVQSAPTCNISANYEPASAVPKLQQLASMCTSLWLQLLCHARQLARRRPQRWHSGAASQLAQCTGWGAACCILTGFAARWLSWTFSTTQVMPFTSRASLCLQISALRHPACAVQPPSQSFGDNQHCR